MSAVDPATVVLAAAAALAAAVYLYYYSPRANQPDVHPLQLAQQASVSRVRESPRESPVYRSKSAPEGARLLATPPDEPRDLRCAFRAGRRTQRPDALRMVAGDKLCCLSSEELAGRVRSFAAGLLRLLGESAARPRSAVLALPGSAEAVVAFQACIEAGVVAIPVAASEPAAALARVIAHSGSAVLVTTAALATTLAPLLDAPALAHIVVAGVPGSSGAATLIPFGDLEQGAVLDADPEISPADIAYVLYAADAPGGPRGVAVTHANALAALAGLESGLPPTQAVSSSDVFMSVAPMAEAANLALINLALMRGCSLGLAETPDAEEFAAQACLVRPTLTYVNSLVTRDLVQLFRTHTQQYPWLERRLFESGYRCAVDSLMRGVAPKVNLWDLLYARHFRSALGGRLRLLYVDGRRTPSKDIEWLRAVHGAKVIPVFGPPETSGVATAGQFFDYATAIETHNVGPPLACNEIKLVDAEHAGLLAEDQPNPRGAVAVRGPNVAGLWWNDPSTATPDDGWVVLPCYGEILPNGTIDIIGSRETVLASALSPTGRLLVERLEHALASSPAVIDVCVAAQSASSGLGILVYPQPMELAAAARRMKKEYRLQSISSYPWCAEYIRQRLVEAGQQAGFQWLAQLPAASMRVKLVAGPFSPANALAFSDGAFNRAAVQAALDAS
ncbi:medium-chain fatty acid-CoA ligase faa2 [Coemansia biformis]|uniref:Medium-chain fatty acid-CoA ligase faa2 n=1 Tax=Coemansia biformis TaxID=1286918 RepID=A0A9W7YFZ4_9FUNG|nr:medium-chain fatty acid-CoA ligase faa2 [Coemansia biformis]